MIDNIELLVWDRTFSLPVEYDCYKGETVTKKQIKALETFVTNPEWLSNSKVFVEDYCREAVQSDDENDKKDNVFSYVIPESIFVKRDKEKPRIALMCRYRYDPEHGLAIVFSSDGEISVGEQGIIL